MSWVKIDDQFTMHPKALRAGNEGVGCWARLLAWSASQLTDGRVPRVVAELIAEGKTAVLDKICDAELLEHDGDDYLLHDYLDYQPSAKDVRKQRVAASAQRSIAGKASANKRAAKGQREPDGAVEPPLSSRSTKLQQRVNPDPDPIPTDRRDDSGAVTLEQFGEEVANAGISIQLGRTDREWFSRLHPIERFELDHALSSAKERKPKRASYLLRIIESDREKAQEEISKPTAPRARRQRDDSADFTPPYLRPENDLSKMTHEQREAELHALPTADWHE